MTDSEKIPTLEEVIQYWLFEYLGLWGLAIPAVLGLLLFLWTKWSTVKTWPGVDTLIIRLKRKRLPNADPNRLSVAVANLAGDTAEGAQKQLILRLIRDFEGIQVLGFDRTIEATGADPEAAERAGHAIARKYLQDSGASVLIWGDVLHHDGQARPDLYLTHANTTADKSRQYGIESGSEFRLPTVFWEDLSQVLRLLIETQDSQYRALYGHYVADTLRPFIDQVRGLVAAADGRPGWDATDVARTRVILAGALRTLGEQTGKNEPLEEAVALYNAALAGLTRERVPLDWAMTQNNLGIALKVLGERESGTERLEAAVAAYRAALTERTRERVPLDWAATQNNLGNALRTLGERKSDPERLEEAVAAYRAALEEFTRERVPLQWAMTQNNLGLALATLGERESDPQRLEEAVAACRAALEEWTRERVPLCWAGTRNNLGNALLSLGERERDKARLEEAVEAYRAALEEYTRERVPLDWANTQSNLGLALWALGERTERRETLVAAREAMAGAFAAYMDAGQEHRRGDFEAWLADLDADIAALAPPPAD